MTVTATVTGRALPLPDDLLVRWEAAAPPDRRTSFSGSGLPFASEEQAFDRPQRGVQSVDGAGRFSVTLRAPNSFHVRSSEHPVPPQVLVTWTSGGRKHSKTLTVTRAAEPARSLRQARFDSEVAFSDLATQEDYLRASGYEPPGGDDWLEFVA